MSGGSMALMASVLTAPTATDALRRVAYVQRLVETTSVMAADSTATADSDAARAIALEAAADHQVVTAADVHAPLRPADRRSWPRRERR